MQTDPADSKELRHWTCVIALAASIFGIFAYRSVVSKYFVGDDFVYLNWLGLAAAEPHRLWSVFWSNSLEATSTHFYRPLLSLSMALDHWLYNRNATGYHLTNLFFNTICSALIYFFTRDFLLPKNSESSLKLWPICAASFFLLYPLHPEVVSWIGGRVDTVATTFVITSLYAFAAWRQTAHTKWFVTSIGTFILALCSKEFAIMVPLLCMAYECCCVQSAGAQVAPDDTTPASKVRISILKQGLSAFATTKLFWLTLIAYFIVRRVSLGTFVGGYDDKIAFGISPALIARNWLDSITMMIIPFNLSVLSPRLLCLLTAWVIVTGAGMFSLLHTYLSRATLRPAINFLFIAAVLFLIPVYKIMSINSDLQSSRLGYLASVSICCLLGLGYCQVALIKNKLRSTGIFVVLVLALTASVLKLNNRSWEKAAEASGQLQEAFKGMFDGGTRECIVIGVPDTINGAYVCRNALPEMHDRGLKVSNFPALSPYQPIGALKDYLSAYRSKIYAWSDEQLKLVLCERPAESLPAPLTYTGRQIAKLFPGENRASFTAEGFHVSSAQPLTVKLPDVVRSSLDALVITYTPESPIPVSSMQLVFHNAFNGLNQVQGYPLSTNNAGGDRRVVFAFRGFWAWQLDEHPSDQFLLCPNAPNMGLIKSVSLCSMRELAPTFLSQNSISRENADLPGRFRLDDKLNAETFRFDASKIAGARGALLEISKPNIWFDYPNAFQQRKDEFPKAIKINKTAGDISLTRDAFPKSAEYCVRVWAIDDTGKVIGLASDHLVLTVDLAQNASP